MIAADVDFRQEANLGTFRSTDSGICVVKLSGDCNESIASPIAPLSYSQSLVMPTRSAEELTSSNSSTSSASSHGSRLYKKSYETNLSGPKKRLYKRFYKANRQFGREETPRPDSSQANEMDKNVDLNPNWQGCPEFRTLSYFERHKSLNSVCDSSLDTSSSSELTHGCLSEDCSVMTSGSVSKLSFGSTLWQPPDSDIYNAQPADNEDSEALYNMVQRNRNAAAKLLPKMKPQHQRDSGSNLHERTPSRDNKTCSSPNAGSFVKNYTSANGSENSSSATDPTGFGNNEEYFKETASVLGVKIVSGRKIFDDDSIRSSSSNDVFLNLVEENLQEIEENFELPNKVVDHYHRPEPMSSSNLVYAVPVKPTHDPPPVAVIDNYRSKVSDHLENVVQHFLENQDHALPQPNQAGATNASGNQEMCRFSTSNSQPKRTVVPVYPLQSQPPYVEQKIKCILKEDQNYVWLESTEEKKVHDVQRNNKTDVSIVKVAEFRANPVPTTVREDSLENCLSKPLDNVLNTVIEKIVTEADDGESSGDISDHESKCRTATLTSCFLEKGNRESKDSLQKEKHELICRLSRKLTVLKDEKREIEKEMKANDAIGHQLITFVNASSAGYYLKEKVRLYLEDVERITKLFLKLSSQFKRICSFVRTTQCEENELNFTDVGKRRSHLMTQLNEAKELKNAIYRRGVQLARLLPELLNADQMVDYQYFIRMKSKLLVEAHEIDEKIHQGELQRDILQQT